MTTSSTVVGSIDELWRFPVKSMRGEQLEQADVTVRGLVGDRAYALIDADSGKVVSAKSVKLFPHMLECQAAYSEPLGLGSGPSTIKIVLSDGTTVSSDSANMDSVLSDHFKRNVTLAQIAPENFTIDQYHPDFGELDPNGPRDVVLDQKLGAAYFAEAGLPSPVSAGSFFDLFPVSVLTDSTLNRLNELRPASHFDKRRFRMNVIIRANAAGFVENQWIGNELRIGEDVRLRVAKADARCVMTTLAQGNLPRDPDILRTLAQHNRVQVGEAQYPCCGVYAVVEAPGRIRTGDSVELA
jgi:MOSC domain-containing protein